MNALFGLTEPKYARARPAVKNFVTKRPLVMSSGLTEFAT